MQYARGHRLLLLIVIAGAVLSFANCILLGFNSMAISMGGHGQEAVTESSKYGNRAEQFFFLSIILIVVAILVRYRIHKLETKNFGNKQPRHWHARTYYSDKLKKWFRFDTRARKMHNNINVNPLDGLHANGFFYVLFHQFPHIVTIIGCMPSDAGFRRPFPHMDSYFVVGHVAKIFSKNTQQAVTGQKRNPPNNRQV
jgi:hypothetical protein